MELLGEGHEGMLAGCFAARIDFNGCVFEL